MRKTSGRYVRIDSRAARYEDCIRMTTRPRKQPQTVLIADDDLEILNLTRSLLRRRGFDVLEASDGDEAISKVLESRPDLVILDVMMPGQSGWEVCRSIRETESLK